MARRRPIIHIRRIGIFQHNHVNALTSLVEDGEGKLRSFLKVGTET